MRRLSFILFVACLSSLSSSAQRRKSVPELSEIRERMDNYLFRQAEEMLETRMEALEKKRQPTGQEEALLDAVERMQLKMSATEEVIFIDSVTVDKKDFLNAFRIGDECGSIGKTADTFPVKDNGDCTLFRNELGNQSVFAMPTKNGRTQLFGSNLIGGEWSKPAALQGLNGNDSLQNHPFMLNDGITLYYAAVNEEEGLGNYDIYMTRYDADGKTFLTPENIGMPFNSPGNDYMYVVDEENNLGWFASDRCQPEGKVCIYTFIPNQTRRIYNEEKLDTGQLARLARIAGIKETWKGHEAEVQKATERLKSLRTASGKDTTAREFCFVVNDNTSYYSLGDFKSAYGKENAKWWAENTKDLNSELLQLEALRSKYADAKDSEKQEMAGQIRILEEKAMQLTKSVKELEKNIRNAENGLVHTPQR